MGIIDWPFHKRRRSQGGGVAAYIQTYKHDMHPMSSQFVEGEKGGHGWIDGWMDGFFWILVVPN
jgi:hypothetical protein